MSPYLDNIIPPESNVGGGSLQEENKIVGFMGEVGPRGETGEKGDTGEGVKAGGLIGQVLIKQSSTDYDTAWGYGGSVKLNANQSLQSSLDAKYEKPVSGIPKSDFSSSVQSSLDKADTAIQEHQSLTGYATENWVESKGYLTQHQSLAAYRTSSAQDVIDATKANAVDLNAVQEKIPIQATSSNQLADKNFVNSSIENVAAYYITKNAQGDSFATKAELNAATVFYSGGVVRVPTRNDYCVVAADESKTIVATGENPTTRYLYNSGWEFQYIVNNSGLTASQWAAVNSNATASGVSSWTAHVADAAIHVTSSDKASWNAKYSKPSGGIPKTDLTSSVQSSLDKADAALPKSGGTMTNAITLADGDGKGLLMSTSANINVTNTSNTVLGFLSGTYTIGHTSYPLNIRGQGSNPKFNGNALALKSEIPTVPTNVSSFTNDAGYITSSYHDNTKQDKLPTPVNNYFLHANASTGALEWAAGGGGGGTGDHTQLTNRDAANQHPISAVTDLQTNLDKKVMGYIEYGTPTTILDTTTLNFTAGTSYATGLYQSSQNVFSDLTLAHLYRITWDGVDYDCLWFQGVMSGTADSRLGSVTNTWGVNMLGHVSDINGIYNEYENDSCPFSFTKNWARNSGRYIWTKDTSATHTIKIVDLNIVIHKGLKNIYLPSPYSRKTNENGFISLLTSSKYVGSVSAIGVAKNTGQHAAAFGLGTTVTGNQAFAEGICCIASGESSHAEGGSCTASGQYAHAEGSGNVASAYATHVSGSSNSVTADGAYAEGTNNTSSGYYAHAEGGWNTASGWGAHVEGYDNTASATMSHVEGESNTASGYNTHVEGFGNNAKKELNHVQGMYAVDDSGSQSWGEETVGNYIDIIGNGTASNARSNAYALGWDGTGHYKGDLYTGCNANSTGGNKVATESWVGQQGYLTEHQSLAAYRTASAQDTIDATKANNSDVVHKTGNETINGEKTFDELINADAGVLIAGHVALDTDGTNVVLGDDSCITNIIGNLVIVPTPTDDDSAATKGYVDEHHDSTKLSTSHASASDAHSSLFSAKEDASNKVTSISSASTDTQYASAKCVYDIVGNIEALLEALL